MSSKVVRVGEDAQNYIVKGIDTVADMVKMTVGPCGNNIIIADDTGTPVITNDGATIAKSIKLKDRTEDAGARLMIGVADKTNEVAGDGTTTTTILTQAMIHNFNKYYNDNKDKNKIQIRKEMLQAGEEVSNYLLQTAVPVKSNDDIKRIATISSGDEDIGNLIAKAYENAGDYGTVIVEDSKIGKDGLKTVEGMKLDRGSLNSFLLNDRVNQRTETKDVSVLITTDKIESVQALFKFLDKIVRADKKLLIICDDLDSASLNAVIRNKLSGALSNISIMGLPRSRSFKRGFIRGYIHSNWCNTFW